MKPPFTTTQEMYNYAANQLIVQNLSPETVKQNIMEHGVTDADAEIVVQNMLVQIEKDKSPQGVAHASSGTPVTSASSVASASTSQPYGSFGTLQEMYNYAAKQLITEKQSPETTRRNLLAHGITEAQADEVIKNMLAEMAKNKPVQVDAKKAEGRKMLLVGLVIAGVGLLLYGT